MYRLRYLQVGSKHGCFVWTSMFFCQVLLPILEIPLYSDAGRSHLHTAFSEVISCCWTSLLFFFVKSHIRVTASDIADVALDWCTDDDISYEEEQKHESGDNVAVPAIVSPHQLSSSSDVEDIINEEVDACTRISHGLLSATSIVCNRSSLVGRTSGQNSFTATTAVLTRISKNIGSRVQYLQCMETHHARSKSSFTCQLHQRRSLKRRMTLTLACVS